MQTQSKDRRTDGDYSRVRKLNWEVIISIRRDHEFKGVTAEQLAKQHNVNVAHMKKILQYKCWYPYPLSKMPKEKELQ